MREQRLFRDMRTGEVVLMVSQPHPWGDLVPVLWAEHGRRPADSSLAQLCELVISGVTPEEMHDQLLEERRQVHGEEE